MATQRHNTPGLPGETLSETHDMLAPAPDTPQRKARHSFASVGAGMKNRILRPEDMEGRYGLFVRGTCCEPDLMDGSMIEVSATEHAEMDDFVVLFFDPGKIKPGTLQLQVKRLVFGVSQLWWSNPERYTGNIQPVVIAEQLNPRRQFYIRPDLLLGYHKVIGPLDPARARFVDRVA